MKRYERYKPSMVEWIGEIPEHWEVKKIRYILRDSIVDGPHETPEYTNIGIPFISVDSLGDSKNVNLENVTRYISETQFDEYNKKTQLKINDILFSKSATIGKVAIVDERKFMTWSPLAIIKCDEIKSFYLYIYYLLQMPRFIEYIKCNSTFNTQFNIGMKTLEKSMIPVPLIDEQKNIANYLDKKTAEIEELISDKLNLISLLEQEKELTISNAVTKGLNPNVTMKNSKVKWIGEIPKHWEVKKIKYIFTSFDNKRVPLSADERGKMSQRIYDYYGASGIIDKVESYIFDGDYLLIGEDGANLLDRNSDLVFKASGKFWVNNHAHILQPIKNDIDFYVYYLENLDFTMWISGSAQPKLTADALNNIHVAVPPIIEQQQIVEYLDKKIAEIDETVQIIKDEIELLKEYKETLIYEVITGKIDVRGWNETH